MFWEPHTASIDFCEPNYLHSSFVVEPHNLWSSFVGITLPGLLGLWYTLRAEQQLKTPHHVLCEWRVKLSHLILAVTGLGSMGLHGTLHWFFQSSDELPMIYLLLVNLYALAELDAPLGKPNYPRLGPTVTAVAFGATLVYYIFREIYWVFLLTFSTVASLTLYNGSRLVYGPLARKHSRDVMRVWYTGLVSYLAVATPVWVLDMQLCYHGVEDASNRLPGPLRGMTPHVLWHVAAGLGGYCVPTFLMLVRCEILGTRYTVYWLLGVLPLVSPPLTLKTS